MELVHSPPNAGLCGEYSALMVLRHLGISASLSDIIALVDTDHGTGNEHLLRALAHFGVEGRDVTGSVHATEMLPELGLVVIAHPAFHDTRQTRRGGHWVAYAQGKVYDSSIDTPLHFDAYEALYAAEGLKKRPDLGPQYLDIFNILEIVSAPTPLPLDPKI